MGYVVAASEGSRDGWIWYDYMFIDCE